jgi:hypothetical protein
MFKLLDSFRMVMRHLRPPPGAPRDNDRRRTLLFAAAAAAGGAAAASTGRAVAQATPSDDALSLSEDTTLLTRVFSSRIRFAAANIPRPVVSVTTLGYARPSDGGGATFQRVPTEPQHAGKVQSADGAWWEQTKGNVDIRQFGAIGDWNQARQGGKDNTNAVQAAIDFVSLNGGGDVHIGDALYRIARPLVIRNQCALVGTTDLEGGGGALVATGSHVFEMPPVGGFVPVSFSLRRIAIIGGTRGKTDFLSIPAGGSWGWSTIEGCYICNLRHIDMIVTGVHFLNNNFQNACRIQVRGADALFHGNFANYDDGVGMYSEKDSFLTIFAAGAIDFSHNYFTSFGRSGTAPRVVDVRNSRQVRVVGNQIDGGDQYAISISDGSHQVVVTLNRIVRYNKNTPILISNVTDILVSDNYVQNLGANDGFISFSSSPRRITVRDNLTNSRRDDTVHDYVDCPVDSDVSLSGSGLSVMHCSRDTQVPSAGFERTYTNLGFTGMEQYFYVDSRFVRRGRYVSFVRLDENKRMIIVDRSNNRPVYDSATNSSNRVRLICYIDGQFSVEVPS